MNELKPIKAFFKNRGWKPFPFQEEVWKSVLNGESGLIHVPTGSGKTYAAVMGLFARWLNKPRKGLKAVYVTPLRALTRDIEKSLQEPVTQEKWPIKIESRTGDTTSAQKRKQLTHPADLLLITPESLAIMISQTNAEDLFKNLEMVILDEWHELMSNKRGTLLELCMTYLRSVNPDLQTWAVSASIGNLEEAAQVAVGKNQTPKIISGGMERPLDIETLLPAKLDSFPWAGHLGFALKEELLGVLDENQSTLLFTNTRSQAERWYQALLELKPHMESQLALHHSSLDREEREAVEEGVKEGTIKWVVCTSSLDLGVDFQPVEKVVQIGSPKMIARMVQRAGRSAHRPGGTSQLLFVPTNSWEILELEAVRESLKRKVVESRRPLRKPIDVLLQHMTTLACGPGLRMDELELSLKDSFSYQDLTREELTWCLNFLTRGGETLKAYPQYHKLVFDEETGRYQIQGRLAMLHRMSIGTIVAHESVKVVYTNRSRIGSVEEGFISKIKKGDVFQFAGKRLEMVMIKDMTAFVKSTKRPTNTVPSWDGGKLPLSEALSRALRETLNASHGKLDNLLRPLLTAQKNISSLPQSHEFLIETLQTKEGSCFFAYPFEGRLVHEGLAQLWAHRFAIREPSTFSFSVNDYGFEIYGPPGYDFRNLFDQHFFSAEGIQSEISQSLQISHLTQRHFRGIAQIAGLVFVGYPGSPKTGRQKQVSASLLYDVFSKHEPSNLLIRQSHNEVLDGALESQRMEKTLRRLQEMTLIWKKLERPSPLSFPLMVDFVASHLSNESLESKVARLRKTWEATT